MAGATFFAGDAFALARLAFGALPRDFAAGFATFDFAAGLAAFDLAAGFAFDFAAGFATFDFAAGFATFDFAAGFATFDFAAGFATFDFAAGFATFDLAAGFATFDFGRAPFGFAFEVADAVRPAAPEVGFFVEVAFALDFGAGARVAGAAEPRVRDVVFFFDVVAMMASSVTYRNERPRATVTALDSADLPKSAAPASPRVRAAETTVPIRMPGRMSFMNTFRAQRRRREATRAPGPERAPAGSRGPHRTWPGTPRIDADTRRMWPLRADTLDELQLPCRVDSGDRR